jgi:hypothetical protein
MSQLGGQATAIVSYRDLVVLVQQQQEREQQLVADQAALSHALETQVSTATCIVFACWMSFIPSRAALRGIAWACGGARPN